MIEVQYMVIIRIIFRFREQSVSIAVQEEAGMKTQAELPIMESTTVAETGTSEVSIEIIQCEQLENVVSLFDQKKASLRSVQISVETKVCSEIPTEIEDDIQIATNKNDDSESAAETDNNSEVVTETEKGSQAVTEVEDALQAVTEGDDELVLTLEENVIDEPESVSVNTEWLVNFSGVYYCDTIHTESIICCTFLFLFTVKMEKSNLKKSWKDKKRSLLFLLLVRLKWMRFTITKMMTRER